MSTTGKNKRARVDSTESEVVSTSPQKSTTWFLLHSMLESDFNCAICHEVLMNASVLGCGHCFCAYCIHMWLRRRPQCPLCIRPSHRFVPLKMVDSFIAQIYASLLPSDLQIARAQELEFREREQLLLNEAELSDSDLDSSTSSTSTEDTTFDSTNVSSNENSYYQHQNNAQHHRHSSSSASNSSPGDFSHT
ncbi:unnamed protein product [Echinostoma caproni]|uniref:RING-type domain-containing protein n=1 Tax=Echinostoma caproni TaxID=27848 RepID=A0A183AAD7_9TREM|nr:unnamed protein product [Echinostoma caproni]